MAINFGFANDFNVFTLNDHTQSNVDSEGRVAVAGNATYTNYGIGSKLTLSLTRPDLIVGGDIDITSGVNQNGNTVIAPSSDVINYTMANANGVPDQPLTEPGTKLLMLAESKYLRCSTAGWGVLPANGTAQVLFGGLVLTGTDDNLNIFNIDGTNVSGSGIPLSGLNQINIVAPLDSTILVNISGASVGFGNMQMFRNGVQATGDDGRYILWNLPATITLEPNTTSIKGSLLAPYATYNSGFSNVEGTIMVENLYGGVEAHNYLFIGTLPDVCTPISTSTTTSTSSTTSTSTTTTSTSSTTSTSTTTTSTSSTTSTSTTTTSTSSTTSTSTTTTSTSSTTSTSTTTTSTSSTTSTSTTTTSTSSTTSTSTTTTSTSSTTSTTTTTSSTSTTSTTTTACTQAITDLIESIALEETALSHILNAEGEKIQKAIALNSTVEELLEINRSVNEMVNTITLLENLLATKLEIAKAIEERCKNRQPR